METKDVLNLLFSFGMFIVTLLLLVVAIIDTKKK